MRADNTSRMGRASVAWQHYIGTTIALLVACVILASGASPADCGANTSIGSQTIMRFSLDVSDLVCDPVSLSGNLCVFRSSSVDTVAIAGVTITSLDYAMGMKSATSEHGGPWIAVIETSLSKGVVEASASAHPMLADVSIFEHDNSVLGEVTRSEFPNLDQERFYSPPLEGDWALWQQFYHFLPPDLSLQDRHLLDPSFWTPDRFATDWDMDLPQAWGITKGDSSVVVVVLDPHGVYAEHPDLQGQLYVNQHDLPGDMNEDGRPGIAGVDDDGDGLVDEDRWGIEADASNAGPELLTWDEKADNVPVEIGSTTTLIGGYTEVVVLGSEAWQLNAL